MSKQKKSTSQKKAVIFDMDGVLVDTEPLNDQHLPLYLKKIGITITSEHLYRFRGTSSKTIWTQLKKEFKLQQPMETLMTGESQSYFSFLQSTPSLQPTPGFLPFIEQLRDSPALLAVGSSASRKRIDMILDRLKIVEYFSVIVCGHDVTNGKPAPDIFLLAAQRLGVAPSACVVIEDATHGVIAAKRAGMKCIGYIGAPHNTQDLSKADLIINNFVDISAEILQSL